MASGTIDAAIGDSPAPHGARFLPLKRLFTSTFAHLSTRTVFRIGYMAHPMYVLSRFSLSDMTRCGIELRRLGAGASSMEEVAQRVVAYLRDELGTGADGTPACALARMFVTLPYAALEPEQQQAAHAVLGGPPPSPSLKCLTLLATTGEEPSWCSRHGSAGHKALPLVSEESIARSPMIAQLIRQLGVQT